MNSVFLQLILFGAAVLWWAFFEHEETWILLLVAVGLLLVPLLARVLL